MPNFRKSFEDGLAAAGKSENHRKEFEAVVGKVADDVRQASDGAISIKLGDGYEYVGRKSIASVMDGLPERKRFDAIIAYNLKGKSKGEQVLCRIGYARETYPITLQWEEQHFYCNDAAGIETALTELLSDPRTGHKFNRLLQLAAE